MNKNFILNSETAKRLYEKRNREMKFADPVTTMNVDNIAKNKRYTNITELFIDSNKKVRKAMRAHGVDEKYITGDGSDFDKFRMLCNTMPDLLGNFMYVQSHYALKYYFGCDKKICPENCEEIWNITADYMQNNIVSAQSILDFSGVEFIGIQTDAISPLDGFVSIAESDCKTKVYPVFNIKGAIEIEEDTFSSYLKKISEATNVDVKDFYTLCDAIAILMDKFEAVGCKSAIINSFVLPAFVKPDKYHADMIIKRALSKGSGELTSDEVCQWKSELIMFISSELYRRGWCLHYKMYVTSVLKLTLNSSYWKKLNTQKRGVVPQLKLLKYLNSRGNIPKTIVYSDSLDEIMLAMNPYSSDRIHLLFGVDGKNCSDVNKLKSSINCIARLSSLGNLVSMPSFSDNILCRSYFDIIERAYYSAIGEWAENCGAPFDDEDAQKIAKKIFCDNAKELIGN